MPAKKTDLDKMIAEARLERERRQRGYREKALKIFPRICGRCGREFEGKKLRELTVHHKDHNHDNNPEDGSNWELLCMYCHENEHARDAVADAYGELKPGGDREPLPAHSPFAGLQDLLKGRK